MHGYHLTAFETLAQAARYQNGLEMAVTFAVFECEGFYREPLPDMLVPSLLTARKHTLEPYAVPGLVWPEGTVMAQRLTLLRRIPEEALREL